MHVMGGEVARVRSDEREKSPGDGLCSWLLGKLNKVEDMS